MGLSGISLTEILIILAIVVLLFGTSKLSRIGGDLGAAIRGFRTAMKDDATETAATSAKTEPEPPVQR